MKTKEEILKEVLKDEEVNSLEYMNFTPTSRMNFVKKAIRMAIALTEKKFEREIEALKQDKKDYEIFHYAQNGEIRQLKRIMKLNFLSPKEAIERSQKKLKLIEEGIISFQRNHSAFINYARDFEYEKEIQQATEKRILEILTKGKNKNGYPMRNHIDTIEYLKKRLKKKNEKI